MKKAGERLTDEIGDAGSRSTQPTHFALSAIT